MHRLRALAFLVVLFSVSVTPRRSDAFCGFYVGGADAKLSNNATQVVLMREGTTTVLSMQNDYDGPPSNFAMVVPVPVVLQEENVKTLPHAVFRHVDELAAPRLVEYWEQDPCPAAVMPSGPMRIGSGMGRAAPRPAPPAKELGVKVEAEFQVGEYQIVILSAEDSLGLDTWIRQQGYKIPAGAEPVLRPYVLAGMKFFVAKVDVSKVQKRDGKTVLSPLRFHYPSDTFSLPVRLGLLNSNGTQDLIVHVLARGQRYEVANLDNVSVPTNLEVSDDVRARFGEFYAALFDETMARHDGGVVTEYSWAANTCDPCPTPALNPDELALLGADVLHRAEATGAGGPPPPMPPGRPGGPMRVMAPPWAFTSGFVLTRLHVRYSKSSLSQDLVFRAAPPIVGGREHVVGADGALEQGAVPSSVNNFQGRYIIRHPWTGAIACKNPQRGRWGGPPGGAPPKTSPAVDTAFAPRGAFKLESAFSKLGRDEALGSAVVLSKGSPMDPYPPLPGMEAAAKAGGPDEEPMASGPGALPVAAPPGGCAGCGLTTPRPVTGAALFTVGLLAWALRRRRRAA